ncbi:AcrR family transcriptional regulator [Paraburkholderia sp. GAS42]|jgi:AcrR family transcriptional regulator
MKEIAERSDTKIGSLYRFFPTKELVADALIQLYANELELRWQAIVTKAATATTEQLADILLGEYVSMRKKFPAMLTLAERGPSGSVHRQERRAQNIDGISRALRTHAPHLKSAEAKSIAIVMIYNMRAVLALTCDPSAPNAPGAVRELKASTRAYLRQRLNSKSDAMRQDSRHDSGLF